MQEAYPLQWPAHVPRTKTLDPSPFSLNGKTPHQVQEQLFREVSLMKGRHLVISTNMPLRRDGFPLANAAQPRDRGVAVYFERKGRPVCFSCDQYDRVWKNMRAIQKTGLMYQTHQAGCLDD